MNDLWCIIDTHHSNNTRNTDLLSSNRVSCLSPCFRDRAAGKGGEGWTAGMSSSSCPCNKFFVFLLSAKRLPRYFCKANYSMLQGMERDSFVNWVTHAAMAPRRQGDSRLGGVVPPWRRIVINRKWREKLLALLKKKKKRAVLFHSPISQNVKSSRRAAFTYWGNISGKKYIYLQKM